MTPVPDDILFTVGPEFKRNAGFSDIFAPRIDIPDLVVGVLRYGLKTSGETFETRKVQEFGQERDHGCTDFAHIRTIEGDKYI